MKLNQLDIEKLNKKIEKELDLKNKSISEVAKKNPSLQYYYLGLLFKEKKKLKKLEVLYNEAKILSYKKNRFNSNYNLSQREANKLADVDDDVIKLKKILDEQIEIVEFLEGVLQIFKSQSFTLNSLLNYYAKFQDLLPEIQE